MKPGFYKINHGYDNHKVKKSEKYLFTFAIDEDGNTFMPINFFTNHLQKLAVAVTDKAKMCINNNKIYLDTKWLAENYSDTQPYIAKLHQIVGSTELCAS